MPPRNGVAWVVILHLSPEYESKLAEVLQATTSMPVTQAATQSVTMEADHVYVVSPNKSLEVKEGQLTPSDITRVEQRRAPVDVFFRTLADAHGAASVAVVLSGTGHNGSAGLKRVKEYGGLTIAQDPSEAEYNDMPRNAIATGLVDFVLPIAEMPSKILAYLEEVRRVESAPSLVVTPADDEALADVLSVLRVRTGHDFSNYKAATLQRRIARRIHLHGLPNIGEYARFIRKNPDEAAALMKELLISVTSFFRDPAEWRVLEERILPRLFAGKRGQDQVRVWVPGCATGEEAYSLAMLLSEVPAAGAEQPSIQVFGTDLDQQAIAVAREGYYTDAEVADVAEERLRRFFTKTVGGYHVRRELRELLLFAHHNVIKDPPFSHLDLISCRNLLIYLNRSIQERVIETFHFALRPGGVLFLGTSESPDPSHDLFVRIDPTAHIYESRSLTSRLALPLVDTSPAAPRPTQRPESRPERISPADLHQRLLEQYAPPSVVVTEEYNLVHASESAGRFMQVPPGEPQRDILRLVRPELQPDLRTALHQAARDRVRVDVRGVTVALEDGPKTVDVLVRPVLREGTPLRGYFVILFQERAWEPSDRAKQLESSAEPLTRQLQDELARVKEQLRLTVEQYETQGEESKASNEELQAMNEELRSATEELETSKEELQSVNEELTTVNQELKIKIEELGLTNNDFQNLINSTDIGTIFVDRSLRLKLFTPRVQDIFNLLPTDAGRPLSNITSRLVDDRLQADAHSVLETLQTIEREVPTQDGRWHLMRVLPYRTTDNRIDGVVITFQDITGRRDAEQRVRQSEERLRLLIDSATDYAIFTTTEDGHVASWNAGAERMFGYTGEEVIGKPYNVLFTPEDRAAGVPAQELARARTHGRSANERFHLRRNGTRFYVTGVTTPIGDGGLGFVKIARDLTSPREAAQALSEAHAEIEARVRDRTTLLESEKQTATEMLRRVVSAQEDERARISRDLHDSLGQQLTALRLALERHQQNPAAQDAVAQALGLTRDISDQIDFLAWELRPAVLDDLGLAAALPRFVEAWSAHVGIPAEVRVEKFPSGQIRQDAEVAFYRVAQEALNNVSKHAHASRVDVVLAANEGKATMIVEDNGVGFNLADVKPGDGIGLASMQERAALVGATLDIESTPGKGTAVYLSAPIAARGTAKDMR